MTRRWAVPRATFPRHGGALLVMSLTLAACGTVSPPPAAEQPGAAPTSGVLVLERRLVGSAALQDRQGRLADEAVTLELLVVLKPADSGYPVQLQTLKTRIAAAVQDRMQRGVAAQKRGQREVAMGHYLAALALRPDDEAAAEALRALERDRNRKLLAVKPRAKVPAAPEGEE